MLFKLRGDEVGEKLDDSKKRGALANYFQRKSTIGSHVCTSEVSSYVPLQPRPPPFCKACHALHMHEAPAYDMQHVPEAHVFCHYACTFYL